MSEERELAERAKKLLDERVESLDPATATRLRAARREALEALDEPRGIGFRVWAPGLALAALVLTITFGWRARESDDVALAEDLEDVEILASGENLDLYEDLEFYDWLDENVAAG